MYITDTIHFIHFIHYHYNYIHHIDPIHHIHAIQYIHITYIYHTLHTYHIKQAWHTLHNIHTIYYSISYHIFNMNLFIPICREPFGITITGMYPHDIPLTHPWHAHEMPMTLIPLTLPWCVHDIPVTPIWHPVTHPRHVDDTPLTQKWHHSDTSVTPPWHVGVSTWVPCENKIGSQLGCTWECPSGSVHLGPIWK